jgi:hypothetical protein
MKLLKLYVAFEVPQLKVKQLKLVLCIGDALMAHHGTPMIKKLRYGSLVYETLFDTLIGNAPSLIK